MTCGRIAALDHERWQLSIKLVTGETIIAGLSQVRRNGQADATPGDTWIRALKPGDAIDVVRDSVGTIIAVRSPPWDDKHHCQRPGDEVPQLV